MKLAKKGINELIQLQKQAIAEADRPDPAALAELSSVFRSSQHFGKN